MVARIYTTFSQCMECTIVGDRENGQRRRKREREREKVELSALKGEKPWRKVQPNAAKCTDMFWVNKRGQLKKNLTQAMLTEYKIN